MKIQNKGAVPRVAYPGGEEGMSQVARQLEVRNHKRRTLNTRLSSGTSAGTFAVSAGPYINYSNEAGTKKRT